MEMILRFATIFRPVGLLPETTNREPDKGGADSFNNYNSLKTKALEHLAFRFRDKKTQGMGGSERSITKFIRRTGSIKCVIPSFGLVLQ